MSNPSEGDLEYDVIEQLQLQGWEYSLGEHYVPHPESLHRKKLSDVLLKDYLKEAVDRLNPGVSEIVKTRSHFQTYWVYW